MSISAVAAFAASLCFAATTMWAGVMDAATMKIRNELVIFLLATYAALAPLAGFGAVEIGIDAAVSLAVLAGMFILFTFGWIGGGDAKLAAVVALWLGSQNALTFILYTALCGGMLSLVLLQFRSLPLPAPYQRVSWIAQLHNRNSGVPYGIAIASAAMIVFPGTHWFNQLH